MRISPARCASAMAAAVRISRSLIWVAWRRVGQVDVAPAPRGLRASRSLVLAGVEVHGAGGDEEHDLPDLHPGVHPQWPDRGEHQRPLAVEADVADRRGDLDEQSEPADRGSAEQQRHVPVGADLFEGMAKVELTGLEHISTLADGDCLGGVGMVGVDHVAGVDQQGGTQTHVVAVGVDLVAGERADAHSPVDSGGGDLGSGQDQCSPLTSSDDLGEEDAAQHLSHI